VKDQIRDLPARSLAFVLLSMPMTKSCGVMMISMRKKTAVNGCQGNMIKKGNLTRMGRTMQIAALFTAPR